MVNDARIESFIQGYVVFRAGESLLQGRFTMPDENLRLWKSTDLTYNHYSFVVEEIVFSMGFLG